MLFRSVALLKSASHHALSNKNEAKVVPRDESLERNEDAPKAATGLHRSATQPMPSEDLEEMSGMSIAERLAALQHSGNTNWKRRIAPEPKNVFDEETLKKVQPKDHCRKSQQIPIF